MSLHSKSNTENERMLDSDLDRASFSNAQFMLLCWYHNYWIFIIFRAYPFQLNFWIFL